nr:hypothetical protein CFP56_18470 [Quercus suber]
MDERKTCYRGFGVVTFADEISARKASKKVHRILAQKLGRPLRKYIGYLHRRCVSKCYAGNFSNAIVGNGPIGTYVGCPVSKARASGVPYAVVWATICRI